MKKLLLSVSVALLFSIGLISVTQAQGLSHRSSIKKHEVNIGYGNSSIVDMSLGVVDDIIDVMFLGRGHTTESWGTLNLGYNYNFENRLSLGISGSYERVKTTYFNPTRETHWTVISLMANAKYYFRNDPNFQLYSGLGLGVVIVSTSDFPYETNDVRMGAFQIRGIGCRYGKDVAVFGEAGFGVEGVVKVGFSARF
jgi:opacity protein-like surface antigen